MCLRLAKNYVLKTAKNDITVFKHLRVMRDGTFQTTYQHFTVEIGKSYHSTLKVESSPFSPYLPVLNLCDIGLHSFKSLSSVKKDVQIISPAGFEIVLVECIIPKGSAYYIGKFGHYISYASDSLKYIKIIK